MERMDEVKRLWSNLPLFCPETEGMNIMKTDETKIFFCLSQQAHVGGVKRCQEGLYFSPVPCIQPHILFELLKLFLKKF